MNNLRRFLIVCLALLVLGASGPQTSIAQTSNNATWAAWHLYADFSQQQPEIIWTSFVGNGTTVLDSIEHDITNWCTIPPLTFDGDYAVFDGNTRIECQTPDFRHDVSQMAPYLVQAQGDFCECPIGGPFWIAADARLELGNNQVNPLFFKTGDGMRFALPINNSNHARTHLRWRNIDVNSTGWTVDPNGNRVWIGNGGTYFQEVNDQMGWLVFMTSLLRNVGLNFLLNTLPEENLGHWAENSQSQRIVNPATSDLGDPGDFTIYTRADTIVIGQDPSTGKYFHGMVRTLSVDPGCRGY
ncbi:MAG: hypothetical protein GFH27_549289n48 [Chloroflexi bacterium AL-W]|nr:hypothetical protein [Chloroflexi bacterium AL-N1]NOK66780.1 hypothetical protein [Chloroflexi bacterium AL-N10]NOK74928.1 hypothetical protein [Chloroflexi bacterium AL-N5]NOK81383.1 hypothetical protein [Chloroflexi bacterium AL-W]NOK88852.1 hypothetical protein [Chloroflexi bacterium AL-N15]